jgi:hypothetical protein
MIAGTTSSTIPSNWERPGWTARLSEAVVAVSHRFDGPLKEPYEPWHYNYDPYRSAVDSTFILDMRSHSSADESVNTLRINTED